MLLYAICPRKNSPLESMETLQKPGVAWDREFESLLVQNHFRALNPDGDNKVYFFPLEQMVRVENKKALKFIMTSIFKGLCKNPFSNESQGAETNEQQ